MIYIDTQAFYRCTSLTSVIIPYSVTSLDLSHSLSLPTVQPGDVNGDGDVTIGDVSGLIDYLLGN